MTRWSSHVTLFQWRTPAFWAFSGLLIAGSALAALEQLLLFAQAPAGLTLSWILLLFYGVPVAAAILALDVFEREPPSLLIGAFLWGAVVAASLAGIANEGWGLVVLRFGGPDFASGWSAALTAPFTEELLKASGVVLLALVAREEMDDLMDGFVLGAMVGLGFTLVEDAYYFVAVFGGSIAGVMAGFVLRVLAAGLYGHVLYTGLAGIAVAYHVTRPPGTRRRLVVAGLFALSVGAHFLWNSPLLDLLPDAPRGAGDLLLIPVALAVKGMPLLVLVVLAVRLAHRQEVAWLRALATGEDAIAPSHLDVLANPHRRWRSVRRTRKRAGRRAARTLRRLHRAELHLVMLRSRDDLDGLDAHRARVRALREELNAMAVR